MDPAIRIPARGMRYPCLLENIFEPVALDCHTCDGHLPLTLQWLWIMDCCRFLEDAPLLEMITGDSRTPLTSRRGCQAWVRLYFQVQLGARVGLQAVRRTIQMNNVSPEFPAIFLARTLVRLTPEFAVLADQTRNHCSQYHDRDCVICLGGINWLHNGNPPGVAQPTNSSRGWNNRYQLGDPPDFIDISRYICSRCGSSIAWRSSPY